ncbi:MAG TPA: indole-3-glycerol phosphate synthase TrpC [Gemmatimonas sp.]|nr:indole-3-glycerol phosphate synthase TrpC [Gemmatimonas sp.]
MQAFSSPSPAQVRAGSSWTPPAGTLGTLTDEAHERAAAALPTLASLRDQARDQPPGPPFSAALRGDRVRVIAEVKRASPTKGDIAPGLDAAVQAAHYVDGGAAAISVLTEPSRFGGSLQDLRDVASRVHVPVIRKDFLVAPVQLWEARVAGASAALLIVRALSPDELVLLTEAARECGLETIVEIRDERELERALQADARVIGVNNRNLETLVIDVATAPRLIPSIPADRIAVAESGMREPSDVESAVGAGADAILVGSAVSAADSPAEAVRRLAQFIRAAR